MVEDYETEDMERLWYKILEGLGFEPLGQRISVNRYGDQRMESAISSIVRGLAMDARQSGFALKGSPN